MRVFLDIVQPEYGNGPPASCTLDAMPDTDQRVWFAGVVAAAAVVLACALGGQLELLVYAAPLVLIGAPLLAGRYLGEDTLERLRRTPERPRRPRVSEVPGVRRAAVLLPRGGRLIAHALAERGPPAVSAG